MDSHVDEELVASVERFVASRAPLPEAGEVFPLPLVNVDLLYVPYQFLLLLKVSVAVDPPAYLLLVCLHAKLWCGRCDRRAVRIWVDDRGRVVGTGGSRGCSED